MQTARTNIQIDVDTLNILKKQTEIMGMKAVTEYLRYISKLDIATLTMEKMTRLIKTSDFDLKGGEE